MAKQNNSKKSVTKTTAAKASQKKIQSKKQDVLADIHKKIFNSSALNGGFDSLMFNIEKIEQNQAQLFVKIDKIHEAIYEPKDGLITKINNVNLETLKKINETDQKLVEVSVWKSHKNKESEKLEEFVDESEQKINILQNNVDDLVKRKNNVSSIINWVIVAISGGSLTLLFKWIESKL